MSDDYPEYANLGELLGDLAGHGVYSIDLIVEQFPKYGFEYEPLTDQLFAFERSVVLGSMTRKEVAVEMGNDKGGILDQGDDDDVMVDALTLSAAVHRLLYPGQRPPSDSYYGRGKGFDKNVEAIRAFYEKVRTN